MAQILLIDDKFDLKVLSKLIREKTGIETAFVINFEELGFAIIIFTRCRTSRSY